MPEQFGVKAATTCAGRPDALGFADKPIAHQFHEIGDVGVDHAVGAVGVVGGLGLGVHTATGDPGRFETGQVIESVEVAVGGVAGVAGFWRPHPIGDLEVTTEGHHVGSGDRAAERGVAV